MQPKSQKTLKKCEAIHYEKLLKELEKLKFPLLVESAEEMQKKIHKYCESEESELAKISSASFPIRHEFPSILIEKSLSEFKGLDMFRQIPFSFAKDLYVNFVTNSTSANVS